MATATREYTRRFKQAKRELATSTGGTVNNLYFTDNGRILCRDHLGSMARFTGRDISGQEIAGVTTQDHIDASTLGFSLECETCKYAHRRTVSA